MVLTTLAGVPTTTDPDGIDFTIVEPYPIIQLSPIVTPLSTVQFLAKYTLFPITTRPEEE